MLIARRSLLVGLSAGALPLATRGALAHQPLKGSAPNFVGMPLGQAPGDYGYQHDKYHKDYQVAFKDHCECGDGDCRVTDWRETQLESPIGFDVIAYREWIPLPKSVYIPVGEWVPRALYHEKAHICAYDTGTIITISCAIINITQI